MTDPTDRSPSERPDPDPGTTTGRGDALVMFGLTGDLGSKKLFPALVELALADRLGIPVVGVGRSEKSDDDLRRMLDEAADDHDDPDAARSAAESMELRYVQGDVADPDTFDRVAESIDGASLPVVYAALPPDTFPDLADAIERSELAGSARLVVEKPFGDDADSARDLHAELVDTLDADRLFVVDHFLAKTAIENLSTVRHANPLIDSAMCAAQVEWVELEMSESGDAADRGSFYESVGAVDDVIQNHLLQTLAMLMMDRPADDGDAAFHAARHELLAAIEPIRLDEVVLGQYDGYREHDGVDDESDVETYADVRLRIDSDRWRDVPVRIRTGKALADDRTQATVWLQPVDGRPPTCVRFTIKPAALIELDLDVLDPEGDEHQVRRTTLCVEVPDTHDPLGDYAVMLDNALDGRQRHFAQIDGIVEGWRIVEHARDSASPFTYSPGSTGPTETSPGPW